MNYYGAGGIKGAVPGTPEKGEAAIYSGSDRN